MLSGVRAIYPQRLMERYKLDEQALALPPYDLLQAIGAKRGMLISGGEVDTERAAKMLVGEFRASKWGRISLERPPQRAEVTDWEGDDADEDEQSPRVVYVCRSQHSAPSLASSAAWLKRDAAPCAGRSA